MGEIADMMLDGTLCQTCGTFIDNPCDYPRYCAGCQPEEETEETPDKAKQEKKRAKRQRYRKRRREREREAREFNNFVVAFDCDGNDHSGA